MSSLSPGVQVPKGCLTRCTPVHTVRAMKYEWDPTKAALNLRKHRFDFADAVTVSADREQYEV